MTYDLNQALFVENGPVALAARARRTRSTDAFRAWRRMDGERRLAVVDGALRAVANDDTIDGLPVAL
jgi:hypothetical protein